MRNRDINIVFVADVHLGHNKVSSRDTYTTFKNQTFDLIREADLFISGGDMFDQSLKLDNESALIALELASDLKQIATESNTKLRFLRGTFTHDRHQNQIFLDKTNILDIKYFESIQIEVLPELGISILYLPDNLPYKDKEDVLTYVKELMELHKLDKVSLVVGHGYFKHKIPPNVPHIPQICFEVSDFKDITNGPILMGHIHQHDKVGDVIYSGSYNRLAHGEESPKGFITINLKEDSYTYKFIENKDAVLHITLDLNGENIDKLVLDITELIQEVFVNTQIGYLRLKHPSSEIRQTLSGIISSKYENLVVTHISSEEKEINKELDTFKTHEFIVPDQTNIPELIYNFIRDNKSVDESSKITLEDIVNILEI